MTGARWSAVRPPRVTLTQGEDRWDLRALCFLNPLFLKDDHELTEDEAGEARALCAECPVRAECLEDALADPRPFGMRAGLSVAQRTGKRPGHTSGDRPWTPEEDAAVQSSSELAAVVGARIGRSVHAVRCRRNVLRRRAEQGEAKAS